VIAITAACDLMAAEHAPEDALAVLELAHASQQQLHVVDERVLGYVLNTKTRHGCTRTVKTSTLR
jgi:hypothetical protein